VPNWKEFFDAHAPRYDENPFAQHTRAEVDFFLSLFPISPGARILDVGCGTGRHSLELASRGYAVTGLDLSAGMLAQARAKAAVDGLVVDWVQADATDFSLDRRFDAAICLCEGGVGLVENSADAEAHDGAIFANIARHLAPGAPFLLTAMNGYAVIRGMKDEVTMAGGFDPGTMQSRYVDTWELPEGPREITIQERLFIAPEVTRMLVAAGFVVDRVFGGTAGHWGQRPLSLDEVEAMFVCRRHSGG
jgi:SAM-dependent methyltransferase